MAKNILEQLSDMLREMADPGIRERRIKAELAKYTSSMLRIYGDGLAYAIRIGRNFDGQDDLAETIEKYGEAIEEAGNQQAKDLLAIDKDPPVAP